MRRNRGTALFVLAVLLITGHEIAAAQSTRVQVGTCKGSLPHYDTISTAVQAVATGGTVFVCPGTYAETVSLGRSLTLQGISTADGQNPTIVVPATGLLSDQAMITAWFGGTVKVDGFVLDGAGAENMATAVYFNATSGTISDLVIKNITQAVVVEIALDLPQTVSVLNNYIHDVSWALYARDGGQTPRTLTLDFKGNWVFGNPSNYATLGYSKNVAGTIANNFITAPFGIAVAGTGVTVTSNTIETTATGISAAGEGEDVVLSSNKISGGTSAISVGPGTVKITGNRIANSLVGVQMNCYTAVVNSNTFVDLGTAVMNVPAGINVGPNNYSNVAAMKSMCVF